MTLSLKENKRQKGKKFDISYIKEKRRKKKVYFNQGSIFLFFYIRSWEDIPKRKENFNQNYTRKKKFPKFSHLFRNK